MSFEFFKKKFHVDFKIKSCDYNWSIRVIKNLCLIRQNDRNDFKLRFYEKIDSIAFIYENVEFEIEIIVRFIEFVFIFINFIELNEFMWMLNFCIVQLILCLKFLLILNLMFRWQLIRCKRLNLKLIKWLSIRCNEKLNIRWWCDFLLNILMRWLKFLTFYLIFFIFKSSFRFDFRWIERIVDVSFILCLFRISVDLKWWI